MKSSTTSASFWLMKTPNGDGCVLLLVSMFSVGLFVVVVLFLFLEGGRGADHTLYITNNKQHLNFDN